MAYVISVCGAGGKTTKCFELAHSFIKKNHTVCILTTTHMWKPNELDDIKNLKLLLNNKIYIFGKEDGEKITFVDEEEYKVICEKFDYVIIEADGSKSKPIKIPNQINEPVIPNNTNEIIIIMGLQALDRKLGVVCQRFNEYEKEDSFLIENNFAYNNIVNERVIDSICEHYYLEPLNKKYPTIKKQYEKIDILKNNNYKKIKKLLIAICASGYSKRFGEENKLLSKIGDLELYKIMIEKVIATKKALLNIFETKAKHNDLQVDISFITQYDEIINSNSYKEIDYIKNDKANHGLSSSIKIAIEKYYDVDAISFINCDLPFLSVNEYALFVYNSICSNNSISSMYTNKPVNPAYFEKNLFNELLNIEGDVGAKNLLDKYKKELFLYHIEEKELFDIDTKDDLMEARLLYEHK